MAKKQIKCGKCESSKMNTCNCIAKCQCCGAINIKEDSNDYGLKEWLDFNYLEYLGAIFKVINEYQFTDLKATSQLDIKAGKFTDVEVDNLRKVLNNGFHKGRTIREIADDITRDVKPKDLFRMKNGKIVLDKEGNPRLQMRGENRGIVISRTETTRIANLGVVEHFQTKGVEKYSWVASLGDRTCVICQELNGRIFPIMSRVLPPAHVGCRCTVVNLIT